MHIEVWEAQALATVNYLLYSLQLNKSQFTFKQSGSQVLKIPAYQCSLLSEIDTQHLEVWYLVDTAHL